MQAFPGAAQRQQPAGSNPLTAALQHSAAAATALRSRARCCPGRMLPQQLQYERVDALVCVAAPVVVQVLVVRFLVPQHYSARRQRLHKVLHIKGVGQPVLAACGGAGRRGAGWAGGRRRGAQGSAWWAADAW